MRSILLVLALLVVGLAGCADEAVAPQDEETTAADGDVKATATTGVIRGVIVDNAIVPLEGAKISIKSTGAEATSLADGSFGFSDLAPGSYFLKVSKLGYTPVQAAATVEAGVEKPPVLRVQLAADETYNPFATTQIYKGLYQCGTSVIVVCAAPNILLGQGTTEDTSTPDIWVEQGALLVQTEMVWESTQAASTELYFEMEATADGCTGDTFLTNAEGNSPIRARAFNDTLVASTIGPDCPIYHSIFAGGAQGTPAGFSLQQDFTWYITEFHGFLPAEDWWFVNDGEALPPQ